MRARPLPGVALRRFRVVRRGPDWSRVGMIESGSPGSMNRRGPTRVRYFAC
jgi:hypothetical protein